MIALTRAQHIALFILGAVFQSLAAIDVPWIAPYRAAILGLSGTLLLLTKSTSVLGIAPKGSGAPVPAVIEGDGVPPVDKQG